MLQYTSITEDMVFEIIERVMPQYVAPFLVTLVKEIYTRSMGIISVTAIIAIWSAAKRHSVYGRWSECGSRIKRDKKLVCTPILGGYLYHCFSGCDCIYACCAGFGNSLRHLAADYLPFIAHLVKIIIKFRGLIMLLLLILFLT